MKKIKLLALPVLAAALLCGCTAPAPDETQTNKAPTVVGVKDVECMVNSTVDLLDGVAALDSEDGDITPKLDIEVSPEVEVNDGYAYFTQEGSYSVSYKITDSGNRTTQKRISVEVVDRETYRTFSMPEGFSSKADGSAEITACGMINGQFILQATGGEIAEDIILSRSFAVGDTYDTEGNKPCTFTYKVNSDKAGKIKIKADGDDCAELKVNAGENDLTFSCTPAVVDGEAQEVKLDLCVGSLGSLDWEIKSIDCVYPQKAGTQKERAEDFSFSGRNIPRIESGAEGNTWVSEGGSKVHLEITKAISQIWLGGMFVNTEFEMKANVRYKISFDVERLKKNDFEIILQNRQWDEKQYAKKNVSEMSFVDTDEDSKGKFECEVTPDSTNAGKLWIYVQSGTAQNEIILSNLSVIEYLEETGAVNYSISDFTHRGGDTFESKDSGFDLHTNTFNQSDDGDPSVESPSFYVMGSGANYVITFKAKASKDINMVDAIPVSDGWDPTILWQRVRVTSEEQVFTFICNGGDSDRLHKIVWQFGGAGNGNTADDVTIQVSDIKVCLRNSVLDI